MCNVEEVGLPGSGVSCASNHFTVEIVKFREKSVRPRGTPGEIFFGSSEKRAVNRARGSAARCRGA